MTSSTRLAVQRFRPSPCCGLPSHAVPTHVKQWSVVSTGAVLLLLGFAAATADTLALRVRSSIHAWVLTAMEITEAAQTDAAFANAATAVAIAKPKIRARCRSTRSATIMGAVVRAHVCAMAGA